MKLPSGIKEAFLRHFFVIGFYLVVTLLMTLPVALQLTTHVAGTGGDPWQTMWRFESKAEALAGAIPGHEPRGIHGALDFIQREFFGKGEPRLVNNSVWPWMPLQLLLGQPTAYNVVWLASFVLSGYAMYVLVDWLLVKYGNREQQGIKIIIAGARIRVAPLLAGLFYAFVPYHVAHSFGHFGAMQLQWLPLAILLSFLFIQRTTVWRAVGLAAVITIQSWSEHHYLLWYGIFILVWTVVEWKKVGRFPLKVASSMQQVACSVLIILTVLFALLPWLPTVRLAFSNTAALSLGAEQTIRFSADLFSFIVPASFHPLWGGLFTTLFSGRFTGNVFEATQYLGLVPLLLLVFFHQRIPKRQQLLWLIVAFVFALIALGPRLHLLGIVIPVPLPYTLIDSLPIFSAVRAVGRAGVMINLAMAVLFGWVVATQVKRQRFALLIAVLLMVEFLFMPVPMQAIGIAPVYDALSSVPGSAVVELPAATNYAVASQALYASRRHGKTVIGSIALERGSEPAEIDDVRSLPALRQLLYLRTRHLQEGRAEWLEQDLVETFIDTMNYSGARAVVVHLDSLSLVQQVAVQGFLEQQVGLVPERFGDALLYQLSDEDVARGDGIFASRDGEWQNVVWEETEDSTRAELVTQATLTLYNTTEVEQLITLAWTIDPDSHGSFTIQPDAEVSAELNQDGVLPQASFDLPGGAHTQYEISLPPGATTLTFANQLPEVVVFKDLTLLPAQ